VPWETRKRGLYFYSARKIDGRVVKTYHGRGPLAEVAADMDAGARARSVAEADAVRVERTRLEAPERSLRELDGACDVMLAATLLAEGFHRPNFARWRPRRGRFAATVRPA
jgi:hypothetical protein